MLADCKNQMNLQYRLRLCSRARFAFCDITLAFLLILVGECQLIDDHPDVWVFRLLGFQNFSSLRKSFLS